MPALLAVDLHPLHPQFPTRCVFPCLITYLLPMTIQQFSLSADPRDWGSDISMNYKEPDDYLHNPDPRRDRKNDRGGSFFTARGLANLGCLFILAAALIALLYVLGSLRCVHSH